MGTRLGALSAHGPKCLLSMGSETILDRQLRLLQDVGVSTVTMVVGYKSDVISSRLGGRVEMLINEQYKTTSSISSLWAVRNSLCEDTLIINGDVVFERELLESVMASPNAWAIAIDSTHIRSDHARVVIREGHPVEIDHAVPIENADATFLSVAMVRSEGLDALRQSVERCAQQSLQTGWSKTFLLLSTEGHDVAMCEYAGPWFDINSVETYHRAQQYVASATQHLS